MANGSLGRSDSVSQGSTERLLPELVAHLRRNRTALREDWARRITDAKLLTAMTTEEVSSEATSVYGYRGDADELCDLVLPALADRPRHDDICLLAVGT